MSDQDARRYTITITPASEAELQEVVDLWREKYGRKHLIHVIGNQPSGTHLQDAPGPGRLRALGMAAYDESAAPAMGNARGAALAAVNAVLAALPDHLTRPPGSATEAAAQPAEEAADA